MDVDAEAKNKFIEKIKLKAKSTFSKSVLSEVGLPAAFYDAKFDSIKRHVLVSCVNGVGTKLKIAFLMNKHNTIGEDIVNRCVNDIASSGAVPIFFMDYLAVGKLSQNISDDIIEGIVRSCKENNCSFIGGGTVELTGIHHEDEYDIAGVMVGVCEKSEILDGKKIKPEDVLIGITSNGLHTNGYSLAHAVMFERFEADDYIDELNMRLGECLLQTHRSYLNVIATIKSMTQVHAIVHVTSGGIEGSINRIIPEHLISNLDWFSWERHPIFRLIQTLGEIPEEKMRQSFNLGLGLIVVASSRGFEKVIENLNVIGEKPVVIGKIKERRDQ
jgi:phosphoribosylformylglycinamidine cyclo-ligase